MVVRYELYADITARPGSTTPARRRQVHLAQRAGVDSTLAVNRSVSKSLAT